MDRRGYFGIGVMLPKNEMNMGTLIRSAHSFGAAFVFTVGRRYKRQPSDTTNGTLHMPAYHYLDTDDLWAHIPHDCVPVGIEVCGAVELPAFNHPRSALYILGPEDGSIPERMLSRCAVTLKIPGRWCLNVATAGSIVMYDRIAKASGHA